MAKLTTDESWPLGKAFSAVLREIDSIWQVESTRLRESGDYHFFVVEQLVSELSADCDGDIVQAWIADSEQLKRINDSEHADHIRYLHSLKSSVYPFKRIQFWVSPNGRNVYFGVRLACRGGLGGSWIVDEDDDGPLLVDDPNGYRWIS